ncbi:MAG: leucine-rich repeat-containing protein kinase family protein [Verrucomicrobiota bacterium]
MDMLSQLRSGELAGSKRLDLSCGLTEFPREIFDLADTLEILNLSGNRLSDLPPDLPRFRNLKILFCSDNDFIHLPPVIGACEKLEMVGFKANRIEEVDAAAFPPGLRWLILTDNRIRKLPGTIGRCGRLQKLMLAGNQLDHLPDEMAACVSLELIRLSANRFREFPEWLFELPRLSWLALAGNPWSEQRGESSMMEIDWENLEIGQKLGEGASGMIYQADWRSSFGAELRPVAVKIFKGEMTSDGLPGNEMDVCLAAGNHPNLIEVLAKISDHPEDRQGLVMSLVDPGFVNLAGPPDFNTCTRDVYPADRRFDLANVLRMTMDLSSVAAHLHNRGIVHGDLYAHNVLWNAGGKALLGDFGAASFYPRDGGLERIEVRAFGCLLEELLERCDAGEDDSGVASGLRELVADCFSEKVGKRPNFEEIVLRLDQLAGVGNRS